MTTNKLFTGVLFCFLTLTMYGQRNGDTVAVTVYTNNPADMPKSTVDVGFFSWNRGVDGLSNGLFVEGDHRIIPEADLFGRLGATGFLSGENKPLAIEAMAGGAYWLTSTLRDKAKQMVPLKGGSYVLNTKLREEIRLGVRGGLNYTTFTYAKKGGLGHRVDFIPDGTINLDRSTVFAAFAGVCFENRSHATLQAEGFGDVEYVRRTIFYADVIYAPSITAVFSENLNTGLSTDYIYPYENKVQNVGIRGGFKKIISYANGKGFVALQAEVGSFPRLEIPEPRFAFYFRAGGTIGLFY